ncbi:hypothetical protein HOB10_01845 [Candidatus Parcubacteria bacterium]|nr:hypothetical protein [Candidatus Parcubacteria bacterium]
MFKTSEVESFKLIIKPGDKKLRNSDYWAIIGLVAIGSFGLLLLVGTSL